MKFIKVEQGGYCPYGSEAGGGCDYPGGPDYCPGPVPKDCPLEEMLNGCPYDQENVKEDCPYLLSNEKELHRLEDKLVEERALKLATYDDTYLYDVSSQRQKAYLVEAKAQIETELDEMAVSARKKKVSK